ncbi:DUF448 domain-containing protein [Campylobacter troglodytis]|uniref:DUF448 domain-containing protein n=1 Tax=Campylobacter troglodytis TaxID=654363 RepID=UPI001FE9F874|nr:DUF448 domain-containing protein [Campylobacter troglodytis]
MLNFDEKKGIIHSRMCVLCRIKAEQKSLIRLQIKNSQIIKFTGKGRSFYICKNCTKSDEKKLIRAFSKINKGKIEPNLREIFNGEG